MAERTLSELERLVQAARTNPMMAMTRDYDRLATIAESLYMQLMRAKSELEQVRSDYESLSKRYQRDLAKR